MPLNTIPNKGLTSRGYPSDRLVTPIIINGDMSVAQRGTSVTGLTNGSSQYLIDRFRWAEGGAPSAEFTMSQDTDVPTGQGFVKSLKLDCTTAQGSLAAGDRFGVDTKLEGQNLQLLKFGTSNAESTTLSFWVKSNKTGTYNIWIYKPDGTARSFASNYTISSASTWEKKTINIPADTAASGAIDNDNGEGFRITWMLAAGTNFNSGTTPTSWENYTAANIGVNNINLADSTSNEWYITGVQLEVGEFDSTTIPSFPFESFENNLRKCQRYFQVFGNTGGFEGITTGLAGSSTANWCQLTYVNSMRSSPSISFTNLVITDRTSADHNVTSIDNVHSGLSSLAMRCVTASGFSARDAVALTAKNTGSGYLRLDSEL